MLETNMKPETFKVSSSDNDKDSHIEGKTTQFPTYRDYSRVAPDTRNDSLSLAAQLAIAKEPTFPAKLHMILSNPMFEDIITWLPHGRSWRILHQKTFEEQVIPLYFRHGNYSSFARQVHKWGFRRITDGTDYNSFYHELFLRGMPHLCDRMKRQNSKELAKKYQDGPTPDFYKLSRDNPLPESTQTGKDANRTENKVSTTLVSAVPTATISKPLLTSSSTFSAASPTLSSGVSGPSSAAGPNSSNAIAAKETGSTTTTISDLKAATEALGSTSAFGSNTIDLTNSSALATALAANPSLLKAVSEVLAQQPSILGSYSSLLSDKALNPATSPRSNTLVAPIPTLGNATFVPAQFATSGFTQNGNDGTAHLANFAAALSQVANAGAAPPGSLGAGNIGPFSIAFNQGTGLAMPTQGGNFGTSSLPQTTNFAGANLGSTFLSPGTIGAPAFGTAHPPGTFLGTTGPAPATTIDTSILGQQAFNNLLSYGQFTGGLNIGSLQNQLLDAQARLAQVTGQSNTNPAQH